MTLVLDAGPLVALADRNDRWQPKVEELLRNEPGRLVVPAPVSAEADYLIGRRVGAGARRAFLADLAAGRFEVLGLDRGEHALAARLDERYADLDLGLADLSVLVIAHRIATTRLATFDERHFRAVTSVAGEPLTLLPFDA